MWIPQIQLGVWGGGGGGAVSPPAGFGAAPRKFLKFMVSITSGHLFLASLDGSFWHSVKAFNPKKMKKSYTVCNVV